MFDELINNIEQELILDKEIYHNKKIKLENYKICKELIKTNNFRMAIINKESNKFAFITIKIYSDKRKYKCKNLRFNSYMYKNVKHTMYSKIGLIPNYVFEDLYKLDAINFKEKYKHCLIQQNMSNLNNYFLIDLEIPFEWID